MTVQSKGLPKGFHDICNYFIDLDPTMLTLDCAKVISQKYGSRKLTRMVIRTLLQYDITTLWELFASDCRLTDYYDWGLGSNNVLIISQETNDRWFKDHGNTKVSFPV